ncbi:ABC transporter permease [Sesbania bispinosa]|nr:ABC transporter permease [Sesbania bispinosa]
MAICATVLLLHDGEDDRTTTADDDLQAADSDLQGGERELETEKWERLRGRRTHTYHVEWHRRR